MSPWERWNWLLWAIWLVFLLLPAWSVLSEADASPAWKAAGLSIVVAFGVAYAVGARRVMGSGTRSALPVLGLLVEVDQVDLRVSRRVPSSERGSGGEELREALLLSRACVLPGSVSVLLSGPGPTTPGRHR